MGKSFARAARRRGEPYRVPSEVVVDKATLDALQPFDTGLIERWVAEKMIDHYLNAGGKGGITQERRG